MGYIDDNLMKGERIIYRSKLHWVIFILPALFFLIALPWMFSGDRALTPVGTFFILIGMVTGVIAFIVYKTSEFGITNKRVIVKVGFISRNSLEVLLSKIEGIQVNQGILGRLLDYGSITISGTGGTKDPFHRIEAPLEFRKKAQEQIAAVQNIALSTQTPLPKQESTSSTLSNPIVSPPPLPSEEEWWIGINGKQEGPFKTFKIEELLSSGKIKDDTYVWKDGMANWKIISEIEKFKKI